MKFTFCKKQYVYLALAIVSACLALTTHVFAQEPNTPVTNQGAPEARGEGRPEMRNDQGGGAKRELPEKSRDRVVNLAENLEAMMRAAIERMTNISSRLDTRILKLKEAGIRTESAETELARAQASLQTAQDSLTALIQELEKLPVADDGGASFASARTQLIQAHSALRETQSGFRNVVAQLKEALRNAPETSDGVNDAVSNPGN